MVVFFDGYCGLCNGFINFLLTIDKNGVLQFTPLQGEFAEKTLPIHLREDLESVIVFSDSQIFEKSDAVLKIFKKLGGLWGLLATACSIIPKFVRDMLYSVVAKNRFLLMKKKDSCRLPNEDERTRFLD